MCGSVTKMSDKVDTKFRKLINKKPHLLRIRATNLGETAPDGYTSLQVTAYANHVAAAKIIFELEKEYRNKSRDNQYSELHLDRNMFGHTALHIAGERGACIDNAFFSLSLISTHIYSTMNICPSFYPFTIMVMLKQET